MQFGRIKRDDSVIKLDEVEDLIESTDWLGRMPEGRTVKNPFTGEVITVPTEGRAFYLVDNKPAGAISLEGGQLLTDGVPADICQVLAERLSASVYKDDRS